MVPTSASEKVMVQRSMPGSLQVSGIAKRFAGMEHPALADVGFDLPPGRFLSVIGPSGCGKTTLLRIIAGLEVPTEGRVLIDGELSLGPSKDKAIVFQHFNLFPWRSARDNVAYGLEMQGVAKGERRATASRYLSLMGLSGFEDHYPHQLSGGMQQRVGLARALAVRPKVLLMDEPFGALDALTREAMQIELEKICAEADVTVIFVTHSIDEAVYLSDEVLVMGLAPGRIVDRITVDLDRPRWHADIRATEDFGRLRGHIWSLLQREMRRDGDDGSPARLPSYE